MAWIQIIDESEATGLLQEVYTSIRQKRGKVSNIMRVHSLTPEAMQSHLDLYVTIMFGRSPLPREEREVIATVVSAQNACEYCMIHHREAIYHYWKDRDRVNRLIQDYRDLDLSERLRVILDYAVQLTKEPAGVTRAHIEALRRVGLSDEEILSVNLIVSYFNFVNRIALGLGVEHTPDEAAGYRY